MRLSKNSRHVMYTPKKNVKNVLQDSIAVVDAVQTLITFNGTIDGTYEIGCKLERKRVECALMVKAALALEGETENEEA